jgi:hypothetical protein
LYDDGEVGRLCEKMETFYSSVKNNGNPFRIPEGHEGLASFFARKLTRSLVKHPFEWKSYEKAFCRFKGMINEHNSIPSANNGKIDIEKESEDFYTALKKAEVNEDMYVWREEFY